MNKVILLGRLTQDPVISYGGENNTAAARYTIAVNRMYKRDGDPDADFFNCVSFGKQGEFVEKYFRKGIKVLIEGEIRNNNYVNRSGERIYSVQIITSSVEFAESKRVQQGNGERQQETPPPAPEDGFMNIPDGLEENIPFA